LNNYQVDFPSAILFCQTLKEKLKTQSCRLCISHDVNGNDFHFQLYKQSVHDCAQALLLWEAEKQVIKIRKQ